MGMIVYHKITTEITGPDGREWLVSVEPPLKAPPEGEATKWEVVIKELLTRDELANLGGVEPEPFTYIAPTYDGMFSALNIALNLVPSRHGND